MRKLIFILLSLVLALPVTASQVRELDWEDLIPNTVSFDDPFETLDREQLEYLGFVARVRNMIDAGKQVSHETIKEAEEIEAELIRAGIDIDGLLARRDEIRELKKMRAYSVVTELDGASIKMPGYVLPLEYSGLNVTEFLLVPWVGACIHTPPPPPNQIVHVQLNEKDGFRSNSMYEPVWVTGEILTQATTRNLFLKDGSGDFNIAYRLKASLVEKYIK
jgi:hypothetical protein